MPVTWVLFDIRGSSFRFYRWVSRGGIVGKRQADNFILLSFTV